MKKRICVISGTRAEYGLLKPVMMAIKNHPALELRLMVTGMHLSKEFGNTIDLIKKDGLRASYTVEMDPKKDRAESMAKAVGKGIIGISSAFMKKRPYLTVVLGDRTEALAGAIASAYLNVPVAHIHGGDITKAGLDESARHAITKLSHIHFAATATSRERIIRMGENPKHVYLVGAPGLDSIFNERLLSKTELAQEYGIDFGRPLILLLQHSVTTQIKKAAEQIKATLNAIKRVGIPTFIIYPNSDAGGRAIIKEIEKNWHTGFIKAFKNVPHRTYLSLLRHSSVLVGNSSSGIIEAPSFKLPVVNIGIRQDGRERSTNIIDVPHDENAIAGAIRTAIYDKKFAQRVKRCQNRYGDGKASKRIVKVLSRIDASHDLLQKQIAY